MALVTAASVVAQYFSSARVYPWEVPTYLHAPLSLYMGLAARRVYGPHQGKITVAIVLAVTGAIAIPALVTKRVLMASLS